MQASVHRRQICLVREEFASLSRFMGNSYRGLTQAMQCETLDENKDGPSREEQSEQHSSADVPPRGPSKREAALAGAHKSPTKADGVVHKKTRDGR